MDEKKIIFTNALVNESSPYLLQHAHNPVNWFPWGNDALELAVKEDKMLLISIGYSACHWCHVMEHECFEDIPIAELMNKYFINVKVDREEHPDIDAVYMHAVQLMTGRGGWPLNCIALPDGRPVYGGTYFPKAQWQQVLLQVSEFYKKDKVRCIAYAEELTQSVSNTDFKVEKTEVTENSKEVADKIYSNWKSQFDFEEGGPKRVPKFPLPNNFEFLLRYGWHTENSECLDFVFLSLDKMAMGGIYDQLGGGFARYSTDGLWKVPHFEKMLYDNAQLVTIYAQAWQINPREIYKEVVYETLDFISREMTDENGAFFSALDADSEGVEGKFYVWSKLEIEELLGEKADLFCAFYQINEIGYWEHGNYILLKKFSKEEYCQVNKLDPVIFNRTINECKKILFNKRTKRVRPGLDDKILVSWNALMLKAYLDAYKVFGEKKYFEAANKNINFLIQNCSREDGGLYHSYKKGNTKINGFLEDYCFLIEALLSLYEVTSNEEYLNRANKLVAYCLSHFYNDKSQLFYFTSILDKPLIARKSESEDNVIPSSNSSLAKSIFLLGYYFPETNYKKMAKQMLNVVTANLVNYGSSYSNWGLLLLNHAFPFFEIAIAGDDARLKTVEINKKYLPNKLLAVTEIKSTHPMLINRLIENKTYIYVCVNQSCQLPVETCDEVFKIITRS